MKKLNKGRAATVVAGAAVLAIFGGGTAVAGSLITSAQIKDNTIVSADVKEGALKGTDILNGSLKGADVQNSSLKGEDIADGGLKGADIKNGTLTSVDTGVYKAVVLANGTKGASSTGVTVQKTGTGLYEVDLGRAVAGCAFTATVGSPTSAVQVQGEADVIAQFGHLDAVLVTTRTAGTATEADLPFMLTAVC